MPATPRGPFNGRGHPVSFTGLLVGQLIYCHPGRFNNKHERKSDLRANVLKSEQRAAPLYFVSLQRQGPIGSMKQPETKARRRPGRPTRSNEELLDQALDLFLEKGFERTSIDAITAAAGMAKRTVYLRYGDKMALFKAALARAIEEWIVPIERLQAAESDDLEETLLRVGQILVANIMSPAGLRLMRITNAESARMPEIGAYSYQQGTGPTLAYLADLFHRRIRPGGIEMRDADEAALGFLYMVVGGPASMTAWGVDLDEASIVRHTRYCVRLFLRGLLPREDETPPRRQGVSEALKRKTLEDENGRLKKLLAESMLERAALKERLKKK
jgi:AcrR family transcriptional regulator